MIFPLCKWYFDINWHKFEKRWADVFQIYPNSIHLNPLQFCPSMPLLGFPVFCLSSSIVLNRYFHILVNSMTICSVLKLPKIVWRSPFKWSALLCPRSVNCVSGGRRCSVFEQLGSGIIRLLLYLHNYDMGWSMSPGVFGARGWLWISFKELYRHVIESRISSYELVCKLSLVLKYYLLFAAKASKRSLNDHPSENRRKKQRILSKQPSRGKERDSWA